MRKIIVRCGALDVLFVDFVPPIPLEVPVPSQPRDASLVVRNVNIDVSCCFRVG